MAQLPTVLASKASDTYQTRAIEVAKYPAILAWSPLASEVLGIKSRFRYRWPMNWRLSMSASIHAVVS
ncbi:hypothetical protein BURK_009056 [Burkholderia sp. SJ98]|nr:hypothetical protein BURK_009056 [Burkholderia sp. SJ98]